MGSRQNGFPEGQTLRLSSKEVVSQWTAVADHTEGHIVDNFPQVSISPSRYHAHPFVFARLMGGWIEPGKSEYLLVGFEVVIVSEFCKKRGSSFDIHASYGGEESEVFISYSEPYQHLRYLVNPLFNYRNLGLISIFRA